MRLGGFRERHLPGTIDGFTSSVARDGREQQRGSIQYPIFRIYRLLCLTFLILFLILLAICENRNIAGW